MGARFQVVVEVGQDLRKRDRILEQHADLVLAAAVRRDTAALQVLHPLVLAPSPRHQVHHRAHETLRRDHADADPRLANLRDPRRRRQQRGILDPHDPAVGGLHLVLHGGRRKDQIEAVLALQTLLHDLHVQQPEETHPIAKAQRGGRFRLVDHRRVRQPQLVEPVAQVLEVGAAGRVEPGEDHRLGLAIAGQRLGPLASAQRHRVADADIAHVLEPRRDIADVARGQDRQRAQLRREAAHLHRLEATIGRREAQRRLRRDLPINHANMRDHALVGVVFGVEDQRPQRGLAVAARRRNALHNRGEQLIDALAGLGRDVDHLVVREADDIDEFGSDRLGTRHIEVDLVDHRDHREVLLERQIDVGERLGLNAFGRVDDEQGALGRCEAARDLVGEIHVARRVDQVQLDLLTGGRRVLHAHRARLDRDPLLALQRHAVEQLRRHIARVDRPGHLEQAIRQRRLAVVDMRDDAEIADGKAVHARGAYHRTPAAFPLPALLLPRRQE